MPLSVWNVQLVVLMSKKVPKSATKAQKKTTNTKQMCKYVLTMKCVSMFVRPQEYTQCKVRCQVTILNELKMIDERFIITTMRKKSHISDKRLLIKEWETYVCSKLDWTETNVWWAGERTYSNIVFFLPWIVVNLSLLGNTLTNKNQLFLQKHLI